METTFYHPASVFQLRTAFIQLLILFLMMAFHANDADADVFTAMVDLENMLVNEAETTSTLIDEYIRSETQRLQQLQEYSDSILLTY